MNYADHRGNISSITRNGLYQSGSCWTSAQIDNLSFTYYANNNKIQDVADSAPTASRDHGFKYYNTTAAGADYLYDANGNMNYDPSKGLTAVYNHLNLPSVLIYPGSDTIRWIYDGAGTKLRKIVKDNGVTVYTQDYVNGIEYRSGKLESIFHAEGRVYNRNVTNTAINPLLRYEYAIRDHLGNTRLTFSDKNGNGIIEVKTDTTNEVLQENHYYPFGMRLGYAWMDDAGLDNRYQYNGKELNEDFGLNWLDYGARWYDAAIGRWNAVDPLAGNFADWSPYNYSFNNSIRFIDPDGKAPDDIILKGSSQEKKKLLSNLQALTNHKLGFVPETGEIFILKRNVTNTTKKLSIGTALIDELITSEKTITVEVFNINGTDPVDDKGNVGSETAINNSQNNVGTGSKIIFNPNGKGEKIKNEDGTSGRPAPIGLAHELLHARNNAKGKNRRVEITNIKDPDDETGVRTLTQEELNVRQEENKIREQMGIVKRSIQN